MADKNQKVTKERRKSRFAAMEALRTVGGFPVAPRKAVSKAKKASKKLAYPLSPYPGANPFQLYKWAQFEWHQLGRRQRLATPVIVLVALLTWERERAMQDERWAELDRAQARHVAAQTYGAFGPRPKQRKLLGIVPLPGGKK